MGTCPSTRYNVDLQSQSQQELVPSSPEEQEIISMPNILFQQDMINGFQLIRSDFNYIWREDLDFLAPGDTNIDSGDDRATSQSDSEEIIPVDVESEEVIYNENGEVVEVIQHFKKTKKEI